MIVATESTIKFDPFAEEHANLKQTIQQLRGVLTEQRAPRDEVLKLLDDLAASVRAHFVHEELEDGFFESVVDEAPWLQSQADALVDEHRDLAAQLSRLQWQARRDDRSPAWWHRVTCRFEAFWVLFTRHEQRENQLMHIAFYQDIGAAD